MALEEIVSMKSSITRVEDRLAELIKTVNSLTLNQQQSVISNGQMPPGMACKIAFDHQGLVIKGERLVSGDIPQVSISKIINLQKTLDEKLTSGDLKGIEDSIKRLGKKKRIVPGTGVKINYDEDGTINSASDTLLISDIPQLPVTHVTGLKEKIVELELNINSSKVFESAVVGSTNPGTYTKITCDKDGRIVRGEKLSVNDIPVEIVNRINLVESRASELASQQTVNSLSTDLKGKVTGNKSIQSGIYTKVHVDNKGLVTAGDKISVDDLPVIRTKDILNLDTTLRKKADQSDLVELHNLVASMTNVDQSVNIERLKTQMGGKADAAEVKGITHRLNSVDVKLDKIINGEFTEQLSREINDLKVIVSNLSGMVTNLEQRIRTSEKK